MSEAVSALQVLQCAGCSEVAARAGGTQSALALRRSVPARTFQAAAATAEKLGDAAERCTGRYQDMMTEHWMPSQLYCARRISAGGVRHVDDWRIKTYRISYDGRETNADDFSPAWTLARAVLPEPARTSARPGLGFAIEHRGRGIDYFVLAWWDRENELPIRIWVREHNAQAVWRAARESESVCVWDLQVLSFERDAFVNTLLAGRADAESAYLDQHLHVNPP